jgi:hypothetical protein
MFNSAFLPKDTRSFSFPTCLESYPRAKDSKKPNLRVYCMQQDEPSKNRSDKT